jgi:GH35 family endo-1,4-beta-xylanase
MRKVVIFISASYLAFIAYANLGHVQTFAPSEPLVSKSYRVKNLNEETIADLKKLNKECPEITAIGHNLNESTIGVTYQFEKTTSAEVLKKLQLGGKIQVTELPRSSSETSEEQVSESNLWAQFVCAHRFHN